MPYTRPWDNTVLGSEPANTIDDIFTQKLTDIQERMDDIVEDWFADPVVPKGSDSIASSRRITYQDSLAAGEKGSSYADIRGIIFVAFTGTTNGSGLITFNFNEINIGSGNVLNYQVSNGAAIVSWNGARVSDGVPVFLRLVGSSGISNTATLEFRHGDGALATNHSIAGTLIITSQADPTV